MARLGAATATGGAEAVPKLNYWYKPALYWIDVCLMVRAAWKQSSNLKRIFISI